MVIENADVAILTFLTGFAGKCGWFDHLMNAMSRFDLVKGVAILCLFWYAWAQVEPDQSFRERDERHERLVNVLIGSLLIGALSRALQLLLNVHVRPLYSGLDLPFPMQPGGLAGLNTWNSFPSDHSMLFCALSAGLWTVNRRVGTIAFIWSLMVIDFPRIYLGIHYPSDVAAGAILGILCMMGFLCLPLTRLNNLISGWRNAHQGAFMAILFFVVDELAHLLEEFRGIATGLGHFFHNT
ncbi:phosphatase PAP2 family protein [Rhodopila sp.]|uniref:phosphatase PAP2 family protein n=1 Tax=Rhodopila sp. TaxID=2480087 RepID=UPI003D11F5F2